MAVSKWYKEALERVENVPIGYEFNIKDLWYRWEWDEIPRSDRLMLGRMMVEFGFDGKAENLGKTKSGWVRWKRIVAE